MNNNTINLAIVNDDKVFISIKTIESHKNNLLLKTGVRNTAELIVHAIENQLIDDSTLLGY